jgi:hypothetical protein
MKKTIRFASCMLLLLVFIVSCGRATRAHDLTPDVCEPAHAHAANKVNQKMFASALITWSPVEVECPVCQTKNIFLEWVSYGNYIYQFPSKYQLVFWPLTDSPSWYSCKKCRLTAYIGEFKEVPKDKIPALREMLKGVSLPPQKELSKKESLEHQPYLGIPVSARLVVAEKVYRTLGRTDDDFWSIFYRVMAYHFDADKKQPEADEARRKALALIERALADKTKEGVRKELLYLSGAMKHFLRDDAAALRDFEEAKKLTFAHPERKAEDNEGYNGYISKLIDEYIEMLRKGEGPRTKKDAGGH